MDEPKKITDEEGLKMAYASPQGEYYFDETTRTGFISGTHIDRWQDIATDLTLPFKQLDKTPRYKRVLDQVKKTQPQRLVGHSLGSAILTKIVEDNPDKYKDNVAYGSPTIKDHKDIIYKSHYGDPISSFNPVSKPTFYIGNPHSYSGF